MAPLAGAAMSDQNTKTTKTSHAGDATLTSGTGVFGSYVQITASTTITYNYLLIIADDANTSNDYEITIATGAEGSETDIIEELNFHVDLTGNNQVTVTYPIKIRIPSGVRVSAKVKATNNTDTIDIHLLGQGF